MNSIGYPEGGLPACGGFRKQLIQRGFFEDGCAQGPEQSVERSVDFEPLSKAAPGQVVEHLTKMRVYTWTWLSPRVER